MIAFRCPILNRERFGKRRLSGRPPLENERATERLFQRFDAAACGPEIDLGMFVCRDRNDGFIAVERDFERFHLLRVAAVEPAGKSQDRGQTPHALLISGR